MDRQVLRVMKWGSSFSRPPPLPLPRLFPPLLTTSTHELMSQRREAGRQRAYKLARHLGARTHTHTFDTHTHTRSNNAADTHTHPHQTLHPNRGPSQRFAEAPADYFINTNTHTRDSTFQLFDPCFKHNTPSRAAQSSCTRHCSAERFATAL